LWQRSIGGETRNVVQQENSRRGCVQAEAARTAGHDGDLALEREERREVLEIGLNSSRHCGKMLMFPCCFARGGIDYQEGPL
jgi:hypothetical protein